MTRHSTTTGDGLDPKRHGPMVARRPSAVLQSHPKRMEGLARRMARCQDELCGMQREAIIALEEAMSRLNALDLCSRLDAVEPLQAELEVAFDEIRNLDHDMLPRSEHLFAIADRLSRLNKMLPLSSKVTGDGGPADAGDDRQPSSDSSDFHIATP